MREVIYQLLPNFLQNILVSLYNYKSNNVRYKGKYQYYRDLFKKNKSLTLDELQKLQEEKYAAFISHAIENSPYFAKRLDGNIEFRKLENISQLPILSKEEIRKHVDTIYTIPKADAVVSKTGGTTGKSLEVLFTNEDFQERFAMLDNFRSNFGYELGKKTAWFSGKNILTNRDIKKNRFWKKDYIYNVKYYSTFHIKKDYLKFYIKDLISFEPEYLVGFPSNILEIAKYGLNNNLPFPQGVVKAIFPTAESVTALNKKLIESYFNCGVYDQYASSEGAPFIIECSNKKLHLELQSGVFEVLDNDNQPAQSGKLVLTSFTTHGTPLIRYDIGDSIALSEELCSCGNNNPLVREILGRVDDYVFSPETGKINLGNISNTLKDVQGIVKFQATQNELNRIIIKVIIDKSIFTKKAEDKFRANWVDRVGSKLQLEFEYVTSIPVEKSGKFRLVKNNIKHLIE
ncbi:phenylacetate--CoA ligase family protein [Dokdonia sp. Asnod3-C12]|uniref:phenylacetate--CoA ligase family protein n=1 Tax=Dokdonia sp. Asnod3-C12 TaxID=3160575 RepID=UPI002627B6D4|nr:phenylacetate--CoA ligase family protein [uncultured Dokdonia sp.]